MLNKVSVTLEALETHMQDRSYEISMKMPKLQKDYAGMRADFGRLDRLITDDSGKEIVNPAYIELPRKMDALEQEINELADQKEMFDDKLLELEDIEERSKGRGNIDKSTHVITMTLSECEKLGYFPEAE